MQLRKSMICEHCEYCAYSGEYSVNEYLYCKFYNDKCTNLIPNKCMFTQKRSRCKYFNMKDGTCPKKCARCMFVNPEKDCDDCDDYAIKDGLLTAEELSIQDMYPSFMTKCLNKPYERKEEEMGEKCNNKIYVDTGHGYIPFESIGEVTYVGGLVKSNYISCSPRQITPKKVIFSGPKTIVIWEDGTKTIVGCAEGQEYDEYAGFCAALAKKIFGTTSAVKRVINKNKKVDISKDKELEEVDFEAIKKSIQNTLSSAIKQCLNMCSSMAFEEKLNDIYSDKEKNDEQSE